MAKRQANFFGLGFSFVGIRRIGPANDNCVSLEGIIVPDGAQLLFDQVSYGEVYSGEDLAPIWPEGLTGQQPDVVI